MIKLRYVDKWGTVYENAVAEITMITYDYKTPKSTVTVDIFGSVEERTAGVERRDTDTFFIDRLELSADVKLKTEAMLSETEKIMAVLASPESSKIATKLDYTTGTILSAAEK
jgi:hypothetical protein